MTAESTKSDNATASRASENTDEKNYKRPDEDVLDKESTLKRSTTDHEYHGNMKAPPVCVASELKDLSMSSAELVGLVFECTDGAPCASTSSEFGRCIDLLRENKQDVASFQTHQSVFGVVDSVHPITSSVSEFASSSCSASSCSLTRDCDIVTLSDTETKNGSGPNHFRNLADSEKLNARIVQRKDSRQGRASQRWVPSHESSCGEPVRLVVGTVPILKGGKILFVSASRKPEWILPKGGWEGDESMEESAVRESFEEAGVIGILGHPLSPIQYETRKSIKRKLSIENTNSFSKGKPSHPRPVDSDDVVQLLQDESGECSTSAVLNNEVNASDQCSDSSKETPLKMSQSMTLENQGSMNTFVAPAYSQVKMTLFPLYVTNVMESWPESGRFRTAVKLEDAIKMMDSRPEFKAFLQEVQTLGLHLTREPK